MAKTCQICYYFEDDWNSYAQCWCKYYRSWTDIDYAEKCKQFKPDSSSGGSICYLTTACVEMRGLEDNCHELTMMRALRDEYMKNVGKEDEIQDYYVSAPKIIACIDAQPEKEKIYDNLYNEYILPCVEMMDSNDAKSAYDKYVEMVENLKDKYKIN